MIIPNLQGLCMIAEASPGRKGTDQQFLTSIVSSQPLHLFPPFPSQSLQTESSPGWRGFPKSVIFIRHGTKKMLVQPRRSWSARKPSVPHRQGNFSACNIKRKRLQGHESKQLYRWTVLVEDLSKSPKVLDHISLHAT